jgi:hypothetical protein
VEILEYVPGALATGWMVVKMAMILRHGSQPAQDDSAI